MNDRLCKWFQNTIQSRLPSYAYVRSMVLIGVILFVVAVILIISFHRYKHGFWHDKPMAWTTILPSKTGVIRNAALQQSTPNIADGYTLSIAQVPISRRDKDMLFIALAKLWDTTPAAVRNDHLWTNDTAVLLLHHASTTDETKQLVGSLIWVPNRIHTPVDDGLDVSVARMLFVHNDHRGKGLAPAMMEHALQHLRKVEDGNEPIAMFAVPALTDRTNNNRLPFSEVARTMRMSVVCKPALLADPDTEVSHQIVTNIANLPDKATECSTAYIETKMTVEPDAESPSRLLYWKHVVAHPERRLLSIGGTDWMHLTHRPNTANRHAQVILNGTSMDMFEQDKLVSHLVQYIKKQCIEDESVQLIVPQPLQEAVQTHRSMMLGTMAENDGEQSTAFGWTLHDAHFVYMYNYKLNPANTHLPLEFDMEL